MLGNAEFCSTSKYPAAEIEKIDLSLDAEEKYLENVIADIQKITEIVKTKPLRSLCLLPNYGKRPYSAGALKEANTEGKFDIPTLIKRAIALDELRPYAKQIPAFLAAI